ncbi:MAG: peptidyl-prolyl cis-trans isomerase [Nitrospira sp.]|nr:peptidyl-prolyl cis-trans isomerase [Nitrospira sp.]MDH4369411.1 peptidyl-prolyl cis-trans isomerase [Nitrospira sp.]MDH5346660.1 peptidyl-prolyl cis-trans isomerase [Nitrospira sp.]MDH5497587.1 peptidyl-prolyl cis-trans isomerase [Nitrospira sp.]MDH5724663.1 peptidyl-prolyl cis-trans isomerase [Nitrospira sp.]
MIRVFLASGWQVRRVLLLAFLMISTWPPAFSDAHLQDRIVAIVNTELIMLSDVKHEFKSEQERLSRELPGGNLAQQLKTAEYMALTKLIERKLQLQEAKTKRVEVSDLEVQQALAQMKQQDKSLDPTNPNDVQNVRDQLILMRVADLHIRGNITVGDSEIKRYYQEHRERFAFPEEYQLSQIIITPRSSDGLADALTKARRAMDDLKRGEKFEDVALQYSDGANSLHGGRLGLVRQGELWPVLEQAVARLVPGGISDIIESPEGVHIIRMDDRKPKQFRPYEDVRREIQELVYQQKSADMYESWLVDLKNKAYIEIKF